MSLVEQLTYTLANPRCVMLLELVLKSTIALVVALAFARTLQATSAARRDISWTATFLFLAVLPILNVHLPGWRPLADGKHLLSVGQAGMVKVWDLDTCESVRSYWPGPGQASHTETERGVLDRHEGQTVSHGSRHYAVASGSGAECEIRIHRVADDALVRTIRLSNSRVTALSFSLDSEHIIAGLENGDIIVWELVAPKSSPRIGLIR